jgi:transcriptional regulator with XRE-family HTH domain
MAGALTLQVPGLRYWRGQRALRQADLATRAGVGINLVYRGETGYPLRVDSVAKLAAALDVSPADLQRQPPKGS